MKQVPVFCLASALSTGSFSQMAINANNTPAHSSAMFDVASTTRGVLLTRMSSAQRTALASPAPGLFVYDTDNRLFYYYDGAAWRHMLNNLHWTRSTLTNAVFNTSDSNGIGTSMPSKRRHINNGQLRLSRSASAENSIVFNMPTASGAAAENEGLKFWLGDVDQAFLGYTSLTFSGNYFRISGSGIGGSDLVITSAGRTPPRCGQRVA